ncbi:DUF7005 family protein [Zobellia sp. B3R18]|uniref:DUF7005 family protein n=1 Tax=Zobellia sp. B3R18 TaxID=2841568 RepID=UPI001C0722CE|nr:hypothetical protein [Zobellia sp. B3R18]MBU2974986.1 hypothetical protein [Zobellia sp. B3R18]
MIGREDEYRILKRYTSDALVIKEILNYTENKFIVNLDSEKFKRFSLLDDPSVQVWQEYLKQSGQIGVFETLKTHLVQLQFPIQKNISNSEEYRAATLKGLASTSMLSAIGLQLNQPHSLKLIVHECTAGKIPILIVSDNEDFSSLIRALSYRNEPVKIPGSMGAAMINGINNWSRINSIKKEWTTKNPLGSWKKEFIKNILPNKILYQDKLIILSKKPYSGISAQNIGLSLEEWLNLSLTIRKEHECAHFYTLKRFGHMANNMHDEMLADYMGITKALGKFNSDWFLKFIGLENYPEYREGGRFQNYIVKDLLSEKSIVLLRTIIKNASVNLELFDEFLGAHRNLEDRSFRLHTLCALGLLTISSEGGKDKLLSYYENLVFKGYKK